MKPLQGCCPGMKQFPGSKWVYRVWDLGSRGFRGFGVCRVQDCFGTD